MADLKQLEFYLLRYVPNVVRGEFVNIGLLLFEPQANGFGFADVRMTSDWRRATCLDRGVDVEVLQALEADVRTRLQHSQDVGSLLHKLEDSFANVIQISPRKVCLAAEPVRELETLCSLYLEEPQLEALPVANRPKGERAVILAQNKRRLYPGRHMGVDQEHKSGRPNIRRRRETHSSSISDMKSGPRFDSFNRFR